MTLRDLLRSVPVLFATSVVFLVGPATQVNAIAPNGRHASATVAMEGPAATTRAATRAPAERHHRFGGDDCPDQGCESRRFRNEGSDSDRASGERNGQARNCFRQNDGDCNASRRDHNSRDHNSRDHGDDGSILF